MRPEILKHLRKDKKLVPALKTESTHAPERVENVAIYLCLSIISQQLSTKVARVIGDRFLDLYAGTEPSCERILQTEIEILRSIGLSGAKAQYIQNVCAFFIEHKLNDEVLHRMNDEEVIALLTQIKGVGRWTVEMLLMFALGREDVFAADDLGVQQAMIRAYDLTSNSKKELRNQMLTISETWSPYRTYACMALWQWKDAKAK
jgi:DNA-3-methyladenine glycosylase II